MGSFSVWSEITENSAYKLLWKLKFVKVSLLTEMETWHKSDI